MATPSDDVVMDGGDTGDAIAIAGLGGDSSDDEEVLGPDVPEPSDGAVDKAAVPGTAGAEAAQSGMDGKETASSSAEVAGASGSGAGAGAGAGAAEAGQGSGERDSKRRRTSERGEWGAGSTSTPGGPPRSAADEEAARFVAAINADVAQASDQRFLRGALAGLGGRGAKHEADDIRRRAKQVRRSLDDRFQTEFVAELLVTCATQLPHRLVSYAALAGLLVSSHPAFAAEVKTALAKALKEAFAQLHTVSIKLLLRFMGELCRVGLVSAESFVAQLRALVDVVQEDGQPWDRRRYAAFLVLSSIVWEGDFLAKDQAGALASYCDCMEEFSATSPPDNPTAAMECWIDDSLEEESRDRPDMIGQVWRAVSQQQDGDWNLGMAARPYAALADDIKIDEAVTLDVCELPEHTDTTAYWLHPAGTLVGDGGYASAKTLAVLKLDEVSLADVWACRDIVHDMVYTFHPLHHELSRELKTWRPKVPTEFIIVETLMMQLLELPEPPHVAVFYFAILADLCTDYKEIQPAIGLAFLIVFKHIAVIEEEGRARLAAWIALHLSNFGFQWVWDHWTRATTLPSYHPQRRFVRSVMDEAFRLGYWDRVRKAVPDALADLMPTKAAAHSKYAPKPAAEPKADAAPTDSAPGTETTEAEEKSSNDGVTDEEKQLYQDIMAQLVAKADAAALSEFLATKTDSLETRTTVATHAILMRGSKSYTHARVMMTRYKNLFQALCAEGAGEDSDMEDDEGAASESPELWILKAISDVWRSGPEAVEVIMQIALAAEVVEASHIVAWAFTRPIVDGFFSIRLWNVIQNGLEATMISLDVTRQAVTSADVASEAREQRTDAVAAARTTMNALMKGFAGALREARAMEDDAEGAATAQALCARMRQLCRQYPQLVQLVTEDVGRLAASERDLGGHDFRTTWELVRAWRPRRPVFFDSPALVRDQVPELQVGDVN